MRGQNVRANIILYIASAAAAAAYYSFCLNLYGAQIFGCVYYINFKKYISWRRASYIVEKYTLKVTFECVCIFNYIIFVLQSNQLGKSLTIHTARVSFINVHFAMRVLKKVNIYIVYFRYAMHN